MVLDEARQEDMDEFVGDFGDFCLLCGEMMLETSGSGGYCSEACAITDELNSRSIWPTADHDDHTDGGDLSRLSESSPGLERRSSSQSTRLSSGMPSPPDSPICERLAILCAGPPSFESLLDIPPLDLDYHHLPNSAIITIPFSQEEPQPMNIEKVPLKLSTIRSKPAIPQISQLSKQLEIIQTFKTLKLSSVTAQMEHEHSHSGDGSGWLPLPAVAPSTPDPELSQS